MNENDPKQPKPKPKRPPMIREVIGDTEPKEKLLDSRPQPKKPLNG